MPQITLNHVTKRWGKFYAVEDLNIVIENNAFVTLLGPSGCGKTTTLRMIAGLETPTSGRIQIGDNVVFDSEQGINVPANKRKVGFLFQNYALWPNMTVYENIAFGLSNVRDNLPKTDFEIRNAARLCEILAQPDELSAIIAQCRDKEGKLDEKKACIRLIDFYQISMFTAKRLLGFRPDGGRAELDTLKGKVEAAKAAQRAAGFAYNDAFELTKDGKPVTEMRKLSKEEIDLAVRRVSRIVKIGMFMDRYPAELSGGQQQRVAIARTLAPEPSVLFMDEPLSNLDAKLRLEMRYELQRLHVETGSTFVYVTHDQMEAMTLATSICLLDNGVLQQNDAPLDVYSKPNNLFVADFVGNPSINFIEAVGSQQPDGAISLTMFGGREALFVPKAPADIAQWRKGLEAENLKKAEQRKQNLLDKNYVEKGNKDEPFRCHIARSDGEEAHDDAPITDNDYIIGLRPEFLELNADGKLIGEVYGSMPAGMETTVKVSVDGYLLTGVVFGSSTFSIGARTQVGFSGDGILLFDRASGQCICYGSCRFV